MTEYDVNQAMWNAMPPAEIEAFIKDPETLAEDRKEAVEQLKICRKRWAQRYSVPIASPVNNR
jgi:hypothetical protein